MANGSNDLFESGAPSLILKTDQLLRLASGPSLVNGVNGVTFEKGAKLEYGLARARLVK